jgi:hypothetical protein
LCNIKRRTYSIFYFFRKVSEILEARSDPFNGFSFSFHDMTILSYSSRIIKYRWRAASNATQAYVRLPFTNPTSLKSSESRAHAVFVFHAIAMHTLKELCAWLLFCGAINHSRSDIKELAMNAIYLTLHAQKGVFATAQSQTFCPTPVRCS